MIGSLDRTFCASPGCVGKCGRQWTKAHEAAAERVGKRHISFAYFCGEPGTYGEGGNEQRDDYSAEDYEL